MSTTPKNKQPCFIPYEFLNPEFLHQQQQQKKIQQTPILLNWKLCLAASWEVVSQAASFIAIYSVMAAPGSCNSEAIRAVSLPPPAGPP
ncbi:uncharacterized [Tachysurus ichikawai]